MRLPELISSLAYHHSQWKPDRWLDPEKAEAYPNEIFGRSRHQCMGRLLAMVEAKAAVAMLLRDYDIKPLDEFPGLFNGRGNVAYLDGPFRVQFTKRAD